MAKVLIDSGSVLFDPTEQKVLVEQEVVACTHRFTFEFLLSAAEVSFGGSAGNLFEWAGYSMWPEYPSSEWNLDDPDGNIYAIPFSGTVEDVWHSFELELVSDGTNITYVWKVDGVAASPVVTTGSFVGNLIDRIEVGATFSLGTINHRSVKNVKLETNDLYYGGGFHTLFFFPTDSFDGTNGVVTISGGIVRVDDDNTGSVHDYAFKESSPLDPTWIDPCAVVCCCDEADDDLAGIGNATLTISVEMTTEDPFCDSLGSCFHNVMLTLSKTWTRVSPDATPGEFEYKIYCKKAGYSEPEPGVFSPVSRHGIAFLAGMNLAPYGLGVSTGPAFRIVDYTGTFVSCCDHGGDDVEADTTSFIDAYVTADTDTLDIGAIQCKTAFFYPTIATAAFGCVDSTHPDRNCGDVWDHEVPKDGLDFASLVGTHIWTDTFVHGGRNWTVTWTLTFAPA